MDQDVHSASSSPHFIQMKTVSTTVFGSTFAMIALFVLAVGSTFNAQQKDPAGAKWRTAWTTSQQTQGMTGVTNTTLRLIARVTVGGEAVRVRLDNTLGTSPLRIGKAYVGLRTSGASLAQGSNRPVLFGGAESVTVPPGGTIRSDSVALRVTAQQDVSVSLYVPDADVRPSQHTGALVTSYLAPPGAGDRSSSESREPFTETTTTMPWLKAVDVLSSTATGVIVAFGDSITDGTCSTVDAHERWEDWLAVRLAFEDARMGGRNAQKAVVNEGIGGNTVTREGLQPAPDSPTGMERLERDVLSHEGVSDVILFMGTNDIRRGASAAQVISGTSQIVQRVKARGLKIVGVTMIPRHNAPVSGTNTGWTPAKTAIRREVNDWIRTRAPFDAVIDFDQVVRDQSNGDLISAPFNCDGIHPTPRGYYEMGKSISLALFTR